MTQQNYGPYSPPGQGMPVQNPQGMQPPYGPPPNYGAPQGGPVWDGQQWVQGGPQQPHQGGYPSMPPQQPPMPPQQGYASPQPQGAMMSHQGGYPSMPPQQGGHQGYMHPGMQDPYAAVDPALRQALEAEEASLKKMGMGGRGDITWFKVRQPQHLGETIETIVRFLPPWPGKQISGFWHKTFTHYIWGEYQGKRVRMGVACPREISKFQNPTQPALPCAVCDRKDQMLAMGDKGGGDQYIARVRFLTNVLDASDLNHHFKSNPETKQMEPVADVMQLGPGLFRSLGKILHQRGDFSSLTTGRLVKIFATKVGREARDVRYDALDCSEALPVPPGFERIRLHDLAALDPIKDYQEVVRLLGEPPRSYPSGYGQPSWQGYDPMMHQQQIQPGYNAQGAPMPSTVMGQYGYGSPQQPPAMPLQQGYGSPQQPPAMPPQQGYGSPQQPPAMPPQQGYGSPQQPPAMPPQQGYGSPQQPPAMPPQQGYPSAAGQGDPPF